MKTLIIIITSLVIVITILLVLFIKEFIRQHKNFLALLSNINREIGYINGINDKTIFILNKLINLEGALNAWGETSEEKNNTITNLLNEIKIKLYTLNNLEAKLNTVVGEVCSKTESIQIPDELLDEVAEYISKKIIKNQAKNSLSNPKMKKCSSKDGKGQNKLKTAEIDNNSHQERIDEIARQQNK